MRSIPSKFSDAITGKKEPGFTEICTLLNFEEMPTALVDKNSQSLLFINSRMMKLTSFSSQDCWHKPVKMLFSDLDLKAVSSGEHHKVTINRRDTPPSEAKVRVDFIDPKGKWIVIKVLAEGISEQENRVHQDEIYRKLNEMVKLADSNDLQTVLKRSVEISRQILGVESACLYQADSAYPQLKKVVAFGKDSDFPDNLPSTDLIRMDKPGIWTPGMRILTELHRFSRINKLDYVATAPLLQGEGVFGLLVTNGHGEVPSSLIINIIELLANQIQSFFQSHVLTSNLNEKVQTSQELVELRNTTFENMSEGVVVLDKDLKITEINPAAEWMLGYANWEVNGQSYENILIGTDRLLPALIEAQGGTTTHNIGKSSLNRRSGQAFPVQIKVMPVQTNEGLSAIEVLITDISENEQSKALTQQLEHRAVLGDYTAAFAHDVRNPINNISTGLQLLAATLMEEDPNQDVINRMQGDCNRLNHLMESFLAFSRPLELKFEPIDVNNFLRRILDRWQPRMARVNVKTSIHIDESLSRVIGDPRSLENVFTNLISNALEAMSETGDTLAVKAENNKEFVGHPTVDISISDNGPGIPQDISEHIFEPFVTTRQKGTGLGLAITKQIVTAHKGSISVNSFPGGTVFTVRLPAETGE